jgi:hypothetical protein
MEPAIPAREPRADRKGIVEFPCDVERLENGNTLITDAGCQQGSGSEIVEVDPLGNIVWIYDEGLRFAHGAKRLANGNTLIADTNNNRILEVTPGKVVVFSSEEWGNGTGKLSDGSHLHYPNDAHALDRESFIITDRNNDRCVIVDRNGEVQWQYTHNIQHPHNCDVLPDGNVIIADSDGGRILEVNRDGETVWEYRGEESDPLNWPRDADRLDNGNTLITDSKNSRIMEVSPKGKVKWKFNAPYFANFYDADKLDNGNVLIADQQHHQVIEVDPSGMIVWQFRNYLPPYSIYPRLKNGSFKKRAEDGSPESWFLNCRLAEGGGKIIWDEDAPRRPCPGLEFDRNGVLYLQQVISVKPRRRYKMGGKMRTELENYSMAYFQVGFLDSWGGYTGDTATLPKGNIFTGQNDWTEDSFEAIPPENAVAAEIRVLLTGPGRIWARGLMVFA